MLDVGLPLAAVDPDRQADVAALDATLTSVEQVLDLDGLRARIEKLEHEAADPNLWTTRRGRSRSPVSCHTPRASCAGWRTCGAGSTTCR